VFKVDSKNYHSWAHRQWAVANYHLWDGELEYTDQLLTEDIRNNSAWNHRWFIVQNISSSIDNGGETRIREIAYTLNKISKVKGNESAWNYLRGIANAYPNMQNSICIEVNKLVSSTENGNVLAISLLADLLEMEGSKSNLETAIGFFTLLADIDKIREKSWMRRIKECRLSTLL
jgi:protein farnesyltransferase/geranylgeranyltransferase type-1 subunit alpha